ncbi:MAG: cytochrome c biogenesis protein CcsA [Bacteroidia bacterium]|nr:cytochrome c biogenesis protein CcsA [Bacteroidia bacterium]MDW8089708.1 cytochrome c biogenesis protein CcsA [Bacteroidia bacterium]
MQAVGKLLIALLWVSGLWGAVAAWETQKGSSLWRHSARLVWLLHTIGVWGTVGLLLYLLLTHRYEFQYVWAHGSRQLPTAYITAALWEGQEGSFLLWMLWHNLLGWGLIFLKTPDLWLRLAGLLGINGYLATFLLGVSLSPWLIAVGGALIWGLWGAEELALPLRVGGSLALLLALEWLPLWVRALALLPLLAAYFWGRLPFRAAFTAAALLLLPKATEWGSFPFLYVWEAQTSWPEGTVPLDGNGLNPLLQSFWMVIHPPVLFGGYAAMLLPFWEALLAFREGGLSPARLTALRRFSWLALTLLGAGIGLGAYWAYETLNFGGYWNWDPVENASLVPWLALVAAVHWLYAYRRRATSAQAVQFFALLPFPLVLYSAYLTRSGVLAESSVHSFTDLGLGEWLLWGTGTAFLGPLLVGLGWARQYLFAASSQVVRPDKPLLKVGVALLLGIAGILTLLTSLPLLNRLLGTAWALGSGAAQVYYEWLGLLAVGLLGLMGYGLMRAYQVRGWEGLLWLATSLLAGISGALWWYRWDFAYHPAYRSLMTQGVVGWLRGAFFLLLDDLILGAALVALGAAVALVVRHSRRSTVPASLAHGGFALMLIGALFSSGYQRTLSQNFSPRSPASADNLFVPLGAEVPGVEYSVRYEGLLVPMPPLSRLHPLLRQDGQILWRFEDSLGFSYQVWLPEKLPAQNGLFHLAALPTIQAFLEANLALLPIEPADRRYRYRIILTHLQTGQRYPLYLEAELSENSGLLAHPAHLRFWHGDLYIHLTSLPSQKAALNEAYLDLGLGDTVEWGGLMFKMERLTEITEMPHPTFRAWLRVGKADLALGQTLPVEFSLADSALTTPFTSFPAAQAKVRLEGFRIKEKKLRFYVVRRTQPEEFISVKILYKPFIGLFWLGLGLVLAGSIGAILRR